MPQDVAFSSKPRVLPVLTAALLASTLAACSDSSRLSENPFTNPFAAAPSSRIDPAPTNSITPRAAPVTPVATQPLPPALPSAAAPTAPRMAMPSTPVAPAPVTGSATGWSADGGTPVTVGPNDTAQSLSNRYGVPAQAILAANGGRITPGSRAIIPVFGGGSTSRAASLPTPAAVSPVVQQAQSPRVAAAPQPAPNPIARPAAPVAQARPPATPVPPQPVAQARPAAAPAQQQARIVPAAPKQAVQQAAAAPPQRVAQAQPARSAATPAPQQAQQQQRPQPRVIPMTPQSEPVPAPSSPAPRAPEPPKADPVTTSSIPTQTAAVQPAGEKADFRWPARGRIISNFGSRSGNGDGIAISVPEGTPVKAAEGGVVAYAGDELKGYGKLVLIRHDNGYVTAYAHNSQLGVKRGDRVSRGQTIAASGATGNVTAPQLHFEVRKGSTPVDPTKYLD